MIAREFFDLLACPSDGGALSASLVSEGPGDEEGVLWCRRCNRVWTIVEGIPRFVIAANVDLDLDIDRLGNWRAQLSDIDSNAFDSTLELLGRWRDASASSWAAEEMRFWEDDYEKQLTLPEPTDRVYGSYNRIIPRRKYILDRIDKADVATVMEIGCGTSSTVASSPAFLEGREYIGTDLSFNALRIAKRRVPGRFALCSAEALPFRRGAFDAIIGFGVLHHLAEQEGALKFVIPFVRDGGRLAFAEKMLAPEVVRRSRIVMGMKRRIMPSSGRHHGAVEKIDYDNLTSRFGEVLEIEHTHFEYSSVRSLLVHYVVDSFHINRVGVTKAIMSLDDAAIRFHRLIPLLAPKNVMFVARKNGSGK
jgi:uncharacterized protein YbaR (Trm112 family)/ubiquinone/menaquinone biosynthesis C-methylase UbiE